MSQKERENYSLTAQPASAPLWPDTTEESVLSFASCLNSYKSYTQSKPSSGPGRFLFIYPHCNTQVCVPFGFHPSQGMLLGSSASQQLPPALSVPIKPPLWSQRSVSWQHLHIYEKGGYRLLVCMNYNAPEVRVTLSCCGCQNHFLLFSHPWPPLSSWILHITELSCVHMPFYKDLLSRRQETPVSWFLFQEWLFPEIGLRPDFPFVLFIQTEMNILQVSFKGVSANLEFPKTPR